MLHSLTIYFFSQWVVGYVILLLISPGIIHVVVPTWQIGWGLGYQPAGTLIVPHVASPQSHFGLSHSVVVSRQHSKSFNFIVNLRRKVSVGQPR